MAVLAGLLFMLSRTLRDSATEDVLPTPLVITTSDDLLAEGDLLSVLHNGPVNGGPAKILITDLIVGERYEVVVTGSHEWTFGRRADAQWSDWGGVAECYCAPHHALTFNEARVTAENGQTAFDPTHTYTFVWVADRPILEMYIWDDYYDDNSGALHFRMFGKKAAASPTALSTLTTTLEATPTHTATPTPCEGERCATPTDSPLPLPTATSSIEPLAEGDLLSVLHNGPVNGGPAKVVITDLIVGERYEMVVTGSHEWTFGRRADAQWSDWGGVVECYCAPHHALTFNETRVIAENGRTAFDPTHTYTFVWVADRSTLEMYIWDDYYDDNSGALHFRMFGEKAAASPTALPTLTTTLEATPSDTPSPAATASVTATLTATSTPCNSEHCRTSVPTLTATLVVTPTATVTPKPCEGEHCPTSTPTSQVLPTATPATRPLAEGDLLSVLHNGPVNGGPAKVVITDLIVGERYEVVVTGSHEWTFGRRADAQWSDWGGTAECYCAPHHALTFNEARVTAENGRTAFDPTHTYTFIWVADRLTLEMYIWDDYFDDNSGALHFRMFGKKAAVSPTALPTLTTTLEATPTNTPSPAATASVTATLTATSTPCSSEHCPTSTPTSQALPTATPATLPLAEGDLLSVLDNSPAKVVITDLIVGERYEVVVTGSHEWTFGRQADAQWSDWGGVAECYCAPHHALTFNETRVTAENGQTAFDPTHTYTFVWVADRPTLEMYIWDDYFDDNSGALHFRMFGKKAAASPTALPAPTG